MRNESLAHCLLIHWRKLAQCLAGGSTWQAIYEPETEIEQRQHDNVQDPGTDRSCLKQLSYADAVMRLSPNNAPEYQLSTAAQSSRPCAHDGAGRVARPSRWTPDQQRLAAGRRHEPRLPGVAAIPVVLTRRRQKSRRLVATPKASMNVPISHLGVSSSCRADRDSAVASRGSHGGGRALDRPDRDFEPSVFGGSES